MRALHRIAVHARPLVLAWMIGIVAGLAQLAIGGCAPHPPTPEEIGEMEAPPPVLLGERTAPLRAPLALTADDGTHLRLSSIEAQAVIDGPLAFTELHLAFESADDHTIEGRFHIELPPRAAISRFAMKIGDEWREGEVVERRTARVTYEEFLHGEQDPALLEHETGNTFGARVFPIAPHERKELIVSYSQEIPGASESYRLGLRGLPRLDAFSARVLRRGLEAHVLTERDWVPDDDLVVATEQPDGPIALRHDELAVARVRVEGDHATDPFGAVTILFDTSASRARGFDTRIRRLGELVGAMIEHNLDDFRLRVIAFDQTQALIFDGLASRFDREELDALASGRALGASDLVGALSAVADDPALVDRLVVVTDGIPTAGATEIADLQMAAVRLAEARIERIDVVLDDGSRDEMRMRGLVTGSASQPGIVVDADLPAATIADKLLRTTLAGIDVSVPGARWVWPTSLHGVQSGDDVLVYAQLVGDAPMRVQLGGRSAIEPEELPAERPLLERAWVRANIEHLQARRSALPLPNEEHRRLEREIVGLSLRFRVLSELTGLLVLETEEDYVRYGIGRHAVADILMIDEHGVTAMRRSPPRPMHDGDDARRPTSGILGMIPPSTLYSPYGAAYAVGNDDEDAWGDERSMPTREPRVRPTRADVRGAIDPDLVGRIVGAQLGGVRLCYVQGLARNPSARGHVSVQLTVSRTGHVAEARLYGSTLKDGDVDRCIVRAVRRWRFPRHEGASVLILQPFRLDPAPGPPASSVVPRRPSPVPDAVTRADDDAFAEITSALAEARRSDALAAALAWRERDPGDLLGLVALGEVAEAIGDRATAARAYGSIIDLHPARADLRRWAGTRLERIGARELARDTYAKALASRDDHPSSHRLAAYAALRVGDHAAAFETLRAALASPTIRWDRFPRVNDILRDDLAIVAAAWIAHDPRVRAAVQRALAALHLSPARRPSARFVLSWETDANDVDFHVEDARGGHASYVNRELASGGELYADIATGYGPECFAIDGAPQAGPYRMSAHYFAQGPMGFGMGTLQIVTHDGKGGVRIEDRPFVITTAKGLVDLGSWSPD